MGELRARLLAAAESTLTKAPQPLLPKPPVHANFLGLRSEAPLTSCAERLALFRKKSGAARSGAPRTAAIPIKMGGQPKTGLFQRRGWVGCGGVGERPRRPPRFELELSGRKRAAQAGSDRVELRRRTQPTPDPRNSIPKTKRTSTRLVLLFKLTAKND